MICKFFEECHCNKGEIKSCDKKCLEVTNESKPTVKSKGVAYTIDNPKKTTSLKYDVDKGLIQEKNNESRCDFIMMFPNCSQAIFIELKRNGNEWEHAFEQIKNTIEHLHGKMSDYTPNLRISVKNNLPNTGHTSYIKLLKETKKINKNATINIISGVDSFESISGKRKSS